LLMLVDASTTRLKEACNSQQKTKKTLEHLSTYVNGEVSGAANSQERKRHSVELADKTDAPVIGDRLKGWPQVKTDAPNEPALPYYDAMIRVVSNDACDLLSEQAMREVLSDDASEMDSKHEFDPDAEWNPDIDFLQRPARSGSA
jgi:hypothetical protein